MAFDWGDAFRGGAQGGIIPGIASGFIGHADPQKEANKYLDQIPGELRKYLEPYIKNGMISLDNLRGISGEYESMYKDPNAIISRIGSGYQQSPGYQWRLNQGENAINNAAASGGMAGTAQHQQQAGQLAGDLANQDFQNYLEQALGVYRGGLSGRTGIEQDIFGKGYGASGDLAASLANLLKGKAGLAYEDAAGRNKSNSDAWSSLLSNAKSIGGLFR
jgi:hypothetical protein